MQWSWFAIALLGSLFDVVGLLAAGAEVKPNHPSTSLCRAEAQVFFSYPITPSSQPTSLCGSNSLDVRRGYFNTTSTNPALSNCNSPAITPTHSASFAAPTTSALKLTAAN